MGSEKTDGYCTSSVTNCGSWHLAHFHQPARVAVTANQRAHHRDATPSVGEDH